MLLGPGARLGPYEIQSAIGAGGMGEVYKAKDTRLDRIVAIKVLPSHVSDDPALRERFEREARTVAALNHSHICTLHDVGSHEGVDYLVLEYLEGQTLADRLTKGALPLDQALAIAIQIADALATAHRAGVVHRDLKPGNIMLVRKGGPSRLRDASAGQAGPPDVKLLDFGLAKMTPTVVAASGLSVAPTGMSPVTIQGAILGTLQYMSPEQIEGQEADARSDIFAFGCVLYEMLTGRKAFEGKTQASLIAAIMTAEPPSLSTMVPIAPPTLDRVLKVCLAKEADDRWQTARDLLRELRWVADGAPEAMIGPVTAPARSRRRTVWAVATGSVVVVSAVALWWTSSRTSVSPTPVRLEATLGADVSIDTLGASVAVSPDGSVLTFVGRSREGVQQLFVRRLGELRAVPLAGTINARDPFFSPDNQWIAFFADGTLKKVAVTGGGAVTLCAAGSDRGGWWAEDGSIVFQAVASGEGLSQVGSTGGKPTPLTKLNSGEVTHRWPQVLPGNKAVLYTAHSSIAGFDDATIVVRSLPDGTPKIVLRGGFYARYLRTGHLVYIHQGTLFALPFDMARLEPKGEPIPVIEGIATYSGTAGTGGQAGSAQIAWTETGTAIYLAGQDAGTQAPIEWMDRTGRVMSLRATGAIWSDPQFSPDGRRLAMSVVTGVSDVFTYEWTRDALTRVTFGTGVNAKPVWTPDGKRLVFRSSRNAGVLNLYWQRADGSGDVQRLTDSPNPQFPASWHPAGKFLAFYETRPQTGNDLMMLPMEGDEASGWKPGKPTVFLSTPFAEQEPVFSPDGRWIAYQSTESGRAEVYVRPFPGPGGRWQISTDGGTYPVWSRTRRELFYGSPDNRLMVASYVVEGDAFRSDKPRGWSERRFESRGGRAFDLHPDGERFALDASDTDAAIKQDRLVFVFNFFDELRRIAP